MDHPTRDSLLFEITTNASNVMFFRKSVAPTAPAPPREPTPQEIEEDLNAAAIDDVVFLTRVPNDIEEGILELRHRFEQQGVPALEEVQKRKVAFRGQSDGDGPGGKEEGDIAMDPADQVLFRPTQFALSFKALSLSISSSQLIAHKLNVERASTLRRRLQESLKLLEEDRSALQRELTELERDHRDLQERYEEAQKASLVPERPS